jgi:hypothetical protein
LLELELAGIQPSFIESLDRVQDIGVDVHGCVHNAVSTDSENAGEFQPVGKQKS